MEPDIIKQMIETNLPGARVMVQGDGTHFEAIIISDDFQGKSLIARHRIVYGTLGNSLEGELHALSMRTHTAAEWERLNPRG